MIIKHLALADLHIDNKDILEYFSRGLNLTLEFAILNKINLCTFSGDTFNRELKSGDDGLYYGIKYITMMCDVVINNNNGYVVICEGTKTHDGDTLKLLEHLTERYNGRFIVVRDVSIVKMDYGNFVLSSLCVPHKYWMNEKEMENAVFNHGNIVHITLYHGDIDCKLVYKACDPAMGVKNIVANPEWFGRVTSWYTCAGHIHTNFKFPNHNIWYIGELNAIDFKSMNYHGQGFEYFEVDTDNNTFGNKRILNHHTKQFVSMDITAEIIKNKIEDITTKLIYHLKKDNTKIKVTCDYAFMNMDDRNNFNKIKDKFSGKIAFEIKNNNVRLSADVIKSMRDDAEFLLDKNTPPSDKIYRVITSLNDIDDILKMQLNSDRIEYLIKTPIEKLQG